MSGIGGPGSTSAASTGSSAVGGGGLAIYSNTAGDFLSTPTTGAKTIVLSAYVNSVLTSSIGTQSFLNALIKRVSSTGAVDTLPITNVAWNGLTNTLTLSDMTANFVAGDTVEMFIAGPDKGFDESKDSLKVSGGFASGSADGGNPVKVGGVYNSTAPTFIAGSRTDFQADSNGNQQTREQYAPGAEDNSNNVIAVAHRPIAVSTYSWTRFQNVGANATLNIKASAGNVFAVHMFNTTGNIRYLQLHNTATTPGGAAVPIFSFLVPANGATLIDSSFFGANGMNFATGIAFACSTTQGTYTAATATDHYTDVLYK